MIGSVIHRIEAFKEHFSIHKAKSDLGWWSKILDDEVDVVLLPPNKAIE
jgi:hypothetical protein